MVLTQAYRQLARDVLLAYKDIHRCYVAQEVCNVVSHLRLRRRGCRAGAHYKRHTLSAQTVKSAVCRTVHPGEIPTVTGNRSYMSTPVSCFTGDATSVFLSSSRFDVAALRIMSALVCSTRGQSATRRPASSSGSEMRNSA